MRERIAAMITIWTNDVAEYHGRYVNFELGLSRCRSRTRSSSSAAHPHTRHGAPFAYGDGWMPIGGRGADILSLLPRFRQMVGEAGRNPDAGR
jgi:alkanesulfonate monooxygenase SsuD/methylene tetrahydromethanopterin reductase-like flavin-dependent oxidoreductase (luciferase family)